METTIPLGQLFSQPERARLADQFHDWAANNGAVDDKGIIHIEKLIELLGGNIRQLTDLLSDQTEIPWSASLLIRGLNDFTIVQDKQTSPARHRSNLAHELGHYVLHANQGQAPMPMTFARNGTGSTEIEANHFAARLLMPQEEFVAAWKKQGSALAVANVFNVSVTQAYFRALALKLV